MEILKTLFNIPKKWGKKNQVFVSFIMDKSKNMENAERVYEYVQACNGRLEIHRRNYEFFVPVKQQEFMILKFPFLTMGKYTTQNL
jgi:hypothetical protein